MSSPECSRASVSAISAKRLERHGVKAVRGGVADGETVRGGEANGETVRGGEETGGEADVEPVIGGEGGGARVETGEDWPVGKGRSTAAVRSGIEGYGGEGLVGYANGEEFPRPSILWKVIEFAATTPKYLGPGPRRRSSSKTVSKT